jgi:hypothetical protein
MQLIEAISPEQEQWHALDAVAETCTEKRNFGSYLWTLGVLFLLLYCAPLCLVRSAGFEQWNASPYTSPLNFSFETAGQDADVVLFGDSTLLHGIDPSQMSAALGVKVLNLPSTVATLRVVDDMALRRYMQANRPPRLIVFYFAPWDFDYSHSTYPMSTYAGLELLAHRGTGKEILTYVKDHPLDSLQFPFQFYYANRRVMTILKHPYSSIELEVARTQGHFANPVQTRLSADCEFPAAAMDDLRFDSVKAMSQQYQTPQTKILYFVAPVPSCSNAPSILNRSYRALPAAPPKEMPAAMFSTEALILHPMAASVPAVTQNLIDAVRPLVTEAKP